MRRYNPVYLRGLLLFLCLPAGSLSSNPDTPPSLETAPIPRPPKLSPLQIGQGCACKIKPAKPKCLELLRRTASDGAFIITPVERR